MPDDPTVDELIAHLGLVPHPEGGYFAETYRSTEQIPAGALPERHGGARATSTAIYYLLTPNTFSALHRLRGDEIFHFYLGDPVEMLQLRPDGSGGMVVLGPHLLSGMRPQILVEQAVWQGLRLAPRGHFALLGTTVAPGFDFADFEMGRRDELIAAYPAFADAIVSLTREDEGVDPA